MKQGWTCNSSVTPIAQMVIAGLFISGAGT